MRNRIDRESMEIIRNFSIVGLVKVLAKVSALLRDRTIALTLGTSTLSDIFLLGFNISTSSLFFVIFFIVFSEGIGCDKISFSFKVEYLAL